MEGNLNNDKTSVSPKNNFWVWIVVALTATVSSIAIWGDSQKDKLITNYKDDIKISKKAIISKKISVKKTIAHYATTSYRAHVISKTSENLFYNASLVIESGAIINLQTKVLQNFIVEFIKSIVHSYNMLYVVEIMPIINFIDLEISKYCKKKEDKDTV